MQTWLDVSARGLAMLAATTALGLGPATFLGRRFRAVARLAIAPAIGLSLGIGVFTSLAWFTPASRTFWLLPLLASGSVAVAVRRVAPAPSDGAVGRLGHALRRVGLRDLAMLAAVCVGVAAAPASVMIERGSVGPLGYRVWDADGYIASTDGMQQESLDTSAHDTQTRFANLEQSQWVSTARGFQNLDATPLEANLNELLGLHSTDTQGPFLIVLLIIGALGAFASVRYLTRKPSWAAALAGLLFAGPFFLQLLIDGSEAAICGLALLLPLTVVGVEAWREPRARGLVLVGVLAGGLQSVYPLFVPPVVLALTLSLLVVGVRRRRSITANVLKTAAGRLSLVLGVAALLDIVSFTRDIRYWKSILAGSFSFTSLPTYDLPPKVIPEWLLQTREFYRLAGLTPSPPAGAFLVRVIVPAILLIVIVIGVRRFRSVAVVVPLVLVCAGLAHYAVASDGCSYCEDRDLLPVAPVGAFLIALGVAALVASTARRHRWSGIAVAVIALAVACGLSVDERLALADAGYLLDSSSRDVLGRIPDAPGSVELEGLGEVPTLATGELPMTYDLVEEHAGHRPSVFSTLDDYEAMAYYPGSFSTLGPEFDPNYRYVLTRAWGVRTSRRLLAHHGAVSLEERTAPLDVTVAAGLFLLPPQLDTTGSAWVRGPLTFVAVGGTDKRRVWVSLGFQTDAPVQVVAPPGQLGRAAAGPGGTVDVCIQATGTAPVRYARIFLDSNYVQDYGRQTYAPILPDRQVRLTSMLVSDAGCLDA